jgi:hypothetical protein
MAAHTRAPTARNAFATHVPYAEIGGCVWSVRIRGMVTGMHMCMDITAAGAVAWKLGLCTDMATEESRRGGLVGLDGCDPDGLFKLSRGLVSSINGLDRQH